METECGPIGVNECLWKSAVWQRSSHHRTGPGVCLGLEKASKLRPWLMVKIFVNLQGSTHTLL